MAKGVAKRKKRLPTDASDSEPDGFSSTEAKFSSNNTRNTSRLQTEYLTELPALRSPPMATPSAVNPTTTGVTTPGTVDETDETKSHFQRHQDSDDEEDDESWSDRNLDVESPLPHRSTRLNEQKKASEETNIPARPPTLGEMRGARKSRARTVAALPRWLLDKVVTEENSFTPARAEEYDAMEFSVPLLLLRVVGFALLGPIAGYLPYLPPWGNPYSGVTANLPFLFVAFLSVGIPCYGTVIAWFTTLLKYKFRLPTMALAIVSSQAVGFGLAALLGYTWGFPVPFSAVTFGVPSWFTSVFVIARTIDPAVRKRDRSKLLSVTCILALLSAMCNMYLVYQSVFASVSSTAQFWIALFLPVMKKGLSWSFWKIASKHIDRDLAPLARFGVHYYHSLFSATLFKDVKEVSAFVVMILTDVIGIVYQLLLMVAPFPRDDDVSSRIIVQQNMSRKDLNLAVRERAQRGRTTSGKHLSREPTPAALEALVEGRDTPPPAVPPPLEMHTSSVKDTAGDFEYRQKLHYIESMIHEELSEIVVPIEYLLILCFIYYGPNREYFNGYEQTHFPPCEFQQNVTFIGISVGLEILLFFVLSIVVWFQFSINLYKLTYFILKKHWWFLVMTELLLMDFTMMQVSKYFGADFKFNFRWLSCTGTFNVTTMACPGQVPPSFPAATCSG